MLGTMVCWQAKSGDVVVVFVRRRSLYGQRHENVRNDSNNPVQVNNQKVFFVRYVSRWFRSGCPRDCRAAICKCSALWVCPWLPGSGWAKGEKRLSPQRVEKHLEHFPSFWILIKWPSRETPLRATVGADFLNAAFLGPNEGVRTSVCASVNAVPSMAIRR
jgi:hypothetical protein